MKLLYRFEWALAIPATLLLVCLHVFFISHAGGLWRDEINTVAVSTIPGFREFLHWLDFDSFPILWMLIMRGWHAVGLGSDLTLRVLGCMVGLCLVGALWFNARAFRVGVPFLSLALFAFNPCIIRYGDSLRGYGLGMCLIILSFAAMWRLVQNPSKHNTVWACVIALLSVHALYYNSLLLFAICCGGVAVCLRHRWWKRIGVLLGIGAVAAVSVTVYIPVFQRSKNWSALFKTPGLGPAWYWQKFSESASPPDFLPFWIWVAAFAIVLALGAVSFFRVTLLKLTDNQRDIALFSAVALLVGSVVYYVFLQRLSYITQPWYYIAFMAMFAAATESSFSVVVNRFSARIVRLASVAILLALALPAAFHTVRVRMTNIDLVAAELTRQVDKNDFVLVVPWFYGLSFNRYYHGPARWETLPPIGDHRFHRPDLLLPYMTAPDQRAVLNPLFEKLKESLATGHRVWIVGGLQFLKPDEAALILSPAPNSPEVGWQLPGYHYSWSTQAGEFLQIHGLNGDRIPVPSAQPVSDYENAPLMALSGWQ